MAKPILVANWKNYPGSLQAAQALSKELLKKRITYKKLSLFIAPPLPYLETASKITKSFAQLAVQNIFLGEKGRFTGETTTDILKSLGVRLAIVGHSERRAAGEGSEEVSQKAKAALKAGITPLVCFGEKERDAEGDYSDALREELSKSLSGLTPKEVQKIVLAYEPVWAIGKSAEDSIDQASLSETVIFIRKILTDLFGRKIAESVPLLYGGSVEPSNAKDLMRTGIRGFLVGHASLKAKSFEEIARALVEKK